MSKIHCLILNRHNLRPYHSTHMPNRSGCKDSFENSLQPLPQIMIFFSMDDFLYYWFGSLFGSRIYCVSFSADHKPFHNFPAAPSRLPAAAWLWAMRLYFAFPTSAQLIKPLYSQRSCARLSSMSIPVCASTRNCR